MDSTGETRAAIDDEPGEIPVRLLIAFTLAASALSTAALYSASAAGAAPSGPDSANDTIRKLENQGHRVVVNRVGAAPLSQCTVTSVTPGQEVTERDPVGDAGSVERVRYRTVYVTVQC